MNIVQDAYSVYLLAFIFAIFYSLLISFVRMLFK